MELWLDSADLKLIENANDTGIFTGVTTNPIFLGETNFPPDSLIKDILKRNKGLLAIQTTAKKPSAIIAQARKIHAMSNRTIIKIPFSKAGIIAITELKKLTIPTLVTAVFEPSQVLFAGIAGATYIAPFIGAIDKEVGDYIPVLKTMLDIIKNYNFPLKILAACLSDFSQLINCAKLGIHAITLPETVYQNLFDNNYLTDVFINKFENSWLSNKFSKESEIFKEL